MLLKESQVNLNRDRTVSHASTGDLKQSQKSDLERHLQINFNN